LGQTGWGIDRANRPRFDVPTNAPSTLRATVNGFASNESLQTLVGPEPIGTLPNCRIASIDGWEFQPIGGGYFFAKVSVSFTQYP